jgi:hypothetical protein
VAWCAELQESIKRPSEIIAYEIVAVLLDEPDHRRMSDLSSV